MKKPVHNISKNNISPRVLRLSLLSLSVSASLVSHAALVRNDIDYQYFRDFAENKGVFMVGAQDIDIYDKTGKKVGTMMQGVPMIDFAPIGAGGVATLTGVPMTQSSMTLPQYMLSVAHNGGYKGEVFGSKNGDFDPYRYRYDMVDNNNYQKDEGNTYATDYHLPRLRKLVTEVAPAVANDSLTPYLYTKNPERYPVFARAGSGTQRSESADGSDNQGVASPYQFLTGGSPLKISDNRTTWLDGHGGVTDNAYGPMSTVGLGGDSGSGIFAYDTQLKRWILTGTLNSLSGKNGKYANTWSMSRPDYNAQVVSDDVLHIGGNKLYREKSAGDYRWTDNGNGMATLSGGLLKTDIQTPIYHAAIKDSLKELAKKTPSYNQIQPDLNHGKTLIFAQNTKNATAQNATLHLDTAINQGAGALVFEEDFVVTGVPDATWQGAGVMVAKDKTVHWQINNPQTDRLSKLGQGTLIADGTGVNLGEISVGDGTLILAQKANTQGQAQAFSKIGIVSARPTVVIKDKSQNLDDIYFGYRGGRLDLHDNDFSTKTINHIDDGATIVNRQGDATLTLTGNDSFATSDIVWGEWGKKGGDIYEYPISRRKDYFLLTGVANRYFPTNQTSNQHWQYVGTDEEGKRQAINHVLTQKNAPSITAFLGHLGERNDSGEAANTASLNVNYQPSVQGSTLVLSGGMNLRGTFGVQGGKAVLSGRPTPHAFDYLAKQEVIRDDDWQSRDFVAQKFSVGKQGALYFGRGANHVTGEIAVRDDGLVNLGVLQGTTPICQTSGRTFVSTCRQNLSDDTALAEKIGSSLAKLSYQGDIRLQDNAQLIVDNATATARIDADKGTQTVLHKNAHWMLNGNSQLGNLQLNEGAQIDLNRSFANADTKNSTDVFNTLTVQGNLTGKGQINYVADFATMQSDKLVVQGRAEADLTLNIKSNGKEPVKTEEGLTLVQLNPNENNHLSVNLAGDVVDLGAYRYNLRKDSNGYSLYNPVVEAQLQQQKAQSTSTPRRTRRSIPASIPTSTHTQEVADQASVMSAYGNTAVSDLSLQGNGVIQMGEALSFSALDSNGAWGVLSFSDATNKNPLHRPYSYRGNAQQVGFLKTDKLGYGAALTHYKTQATLSDDMQASHDNYMASALVKYQNHATSVAADIGVGTTKAVVAGATTNRTIASMGLTASHRFDKGALSLMPSAYVRHSQFKGARYTVNGADVTIDNDKLSQVGAKVRAQYTMQTDGLTVAPSVDIGAMRVYGDGNVLVNDQRFVQKFDDRYYGSVGVQVAHGNLSGGLSASKDFGEQKQTKIGASFQYRW